jgi:serine/threonine-protein kinase
MHVRLQPIPPTHIDPDIPEALESIILRAMEKIPAARYGSAAEMQKALEKFAKEYHTPKHREEPKDLTPVEKVKQVALDYIHHFSLPSMIVGVLCALLVSIVFSLGILSEALISERHDPDHVKVPDLVGRELSRALDELDLDYYKFEISYVDDLSKRGRILEQSPTAGSVERLADGEPCTVKLTVAHHPLPSAMPDLRSFDAEEILTLLRGYDCEVEVVEQPHEYLEKGYILGTRPAAGETTTHKITLYVSAGWQIQQDDTE